MGRTRIAANETNETKDECECVCVQNSTIPWDMCADMQQLQHKTEQRKFSKTFKSVINIKELDKNILVGDVRVHKQAKRMN